ncbi:MAG: DNA-directed RNA polymerase subunit alpha C-terminal domain-containing protein [Gemmatales bacterium]
MGKLPNGLLKALNLSTPTSFELLSQSSYTIIDIYQDRTVLGYLSTWVEPQLKAGRVSLDSLAFPKGVPSSLKLSTLPLHNRTRNCLQRTNFYAPEKLAQLSINDLLNIPAFGINSLLDLLTAVEAVSAESCPAVSQEVELGTQLHRKTPLRSLVPSALRSIVTGIVPLKIRRELNLTEGVTLDTPEVYFEVTNHKQDKWLLSWITKKIEPALRLGKLPLCSAAFPKGIPDCIELNILPLLNRTRNCLRRQNLNSASQLGQLTIGQLLQIHAFGVLSLVDLLSAIDGSIRKSDQPNIATSISSITTTSIQDTNDVMSLQSRLSREARLLSTEPWAMKAMINDIRLGSVLLRDERAIDEICKALSKGTIHPDQQVCTDNITIDLDLLKCPLLTRTKNGLRASGLRTLSMVKSLTIREVSRLPGFGQKSVADLIVLLDMLRFLSNSTTKIGEELTLSDFCRGIIDRKSDGWFPERLANRLHDVRALGLKFLSITLETELFELITSVYDERPEVIQKHLGWDGNGPQSLESVGKPEGLSRERVRQLVDKVTSEIRNANSWLPKLSQSLDLCVESSPLPLWKMSELLFQSDLSSVQFHPGGLLAASQILGSSSYLSISRIGHSDWIFHKQQEGLVKRALEITKKAMSERNACSLAYLKAELDAEGFTQQEKIEEWLTFLPSFSWLDSDKEWFVLDTEWSTLRTMLWKVLAVAPEIQVGELRGGLTRHHRLQAVPPSSILLQVCKHLGLQVSGNTVSVTSHVNPKSVLSDVEHLFFELLSKENLLMPAYELEKLCLERDMNRSTFWAYLTYSPILARYATGVYGLRGAKVFPGQAERLVRTKNRPRSLQDWGWKSHDTIWVAYSITESTMRSGVVTFPKGIHQFLSNDTLSLLAMDGKQVGTLVIKNGSAWGFKPYLTRQGIDLGDVMVLEIGRNRTSQIRLGNVELMEQLKGNIATQIGDCE